MSVGKALAPEDIAKLDEAIALARKSSRDFAGEFQSNEATFVYACLDALEAFAILLKAMPEAFAAVHHSIEMERLQLNDTLRLSRETVIALGRIDDNVVRKQVIDLTSQLLSSLEPEIENRARLINEKIAMKQIAWLCSFAAIITLIIFFIGRFSV
ncbi:hypothetical protein AA0488_2785 [Kozakia baliensis NRIC 0488]|uniref:hypothetical protein n=1 Tax=Kozakia baliensis TaxID=153496 RepID=UPI0021568FC0|nr:hypothetical protein [Kozakia baliensis]GBR33865.1 hypothetical protein AA0488_2785 [Kozakia baliensis NRIC 0488]